jgi:hypothetical protein
VTGAGWLLLGVSWLTIGSLAVYCLYRTLRIDGLKHDDDETP